MATAKLHPYTTKDGSSTYRIRYDYVEPETGKRCQPWETLPRGIGEREARALMARKVAELNSLPFVSPSKLSVGALMREWLEREARTSVAATTLEDVDGPRGVLAVRQSLVVLDGHRHIKAPKTRGSRSLVVVDAEMGEWLAEHREAQRARRGHLGERWQESGLVVTTGVGTAIAPDNVTREYDRLLTLTDLKRIRVHDMRHTFGTLLHRGGTDLKVISEMMRHSKISTTGDIYVKADLVLQREAVERLAAAMREAPIPDPRAKKRATSGGTC